MKFAQTAFFVLALFVSINFVNAQATAFTYQGRLSDNGATANGNYEFRFILFNVSEFGFPVGPILTNSSVSVSGGLFMVMLDFGNGIFTGTNYWLEIGVRTNGSTGSFTTLLPRQSITSTPYAIQSANAVTATTALTATSANSVSAANITGTIPDVRLSSNVALLSGPANFSGIVSASGFSGSGAGLTDLHVQGAIPWQLVSGTSVQTEPNKGYLLTNDSLITVSLPTMPNIGEMVRIASIGVNGWRINLNQGQTLRAQTNGWPLQLTNQNWSSAASSYDGFNLAAAVLPGRIYISSDSGNTWTPAETNRYWRSIASSSDGSKLVAVAANYAGASDKTYTSTDSGNTWTARENNRQWRSVASSADGSNLVAVVWGGQIYTSTDSGIVWTPRETARNWYCVASSADGSKLVAGDFGGQIYISSDSGDTWSARGTNRNWTSIASSSDGTKLIAGTQGGTSIYISMDSGITWTAQSNVVGSAAGVYVASSTDGTKLVCAVWGGRIWTSTDSGITWSARENSRQWRSVASSADGSKLVAVVEEGQIYTSKNSGATWTVPILLGSGDSSVDLLYIGNGQFLAF